MNLNTCRKKININLWSFLSKTLINAKLATP